MFKPIPGFKNLYEVSACGEVRSLDRTVPCKLSKRGIRNIKGRIKRLSNDGKGYLVTRLTDEHGVSRNFFVHQLVALAYIQNPYNHIVINHKDGNPRNNKAHNLEWCTQKHNIKHAYATKLIPTKAVIQFDLKGQELHRYKSIKDAAKAVGHSKRSGDIHHCCTGHKNREIAYGYKWKFE